MHIKVKDELDDKIEEVGRYIEENFHPDDGLKIQLGVSGGKDSTASYLLFHELGLDFVPVFADTDNEHPDTVKHAMTLHERVPGAPAVNRVKKTFPPELFERRRANLRKTWSRPHRIRAGAQRGEMMPAFDEATIEAACDVLHPTGNSFLDMALLHGMFPLRRSQFCTLELKLLPVSEAYIDPWVEEGLDVLTCSGVRADESIKRRDLPRHELRVEYEGEADADGQAPQVFIYRPILDWTAQDCFAMHRRHNVEPNPLYKQGMARVGCMPCIHANQAELVDIHKRFPEQLERVEAWEALAAKASRWAQYKGKDRISFLGPRNIGSTEHDTAPERHMFYHITEFVNWLYTKPHFDDEEDAPFCASIYGLCE